MEMINPIRPDDQTLDDLFQKAIVNENNLFHFDLYLIYLLVYNGFTSR